MFEIRVKNDISVFTHNECFMQKHNLEYTYTVVINFMNTMHVKHVTNDSQSLKIWRLLMTFTMVIKPY